MISGGGTGGHVYPALAVVESLTITGPRDVSLLYVGSTGGVEEGLVQRQEIAFRAIAAGQVRGLAPWTVARNLIRLGKGLLQARCIVAEFAPQVVLVTGGYVCVPVALAAWMRRIPVMVYLPDLEPGLAIRVLSRFATRVAVSFPEVTRYFGAGRALVTGYPVRDAFFTMNKAAARATFDLEAELPVVTVFGGSRGARSINRALCSILDELLEGCQVMHVSGSLDADWVAERARSLRPDLRSRYRHYAYLYEEMVDALAAADLVVARAGASTLGEFPVLGLSSILVPYPYAGQHQEVNADYLVERGAAVKIADAELGAKLLPTIRDLLEDRERLAEMGARARTLARPEATRLITEELTRLAGESRGTDLHVAE
jgi:UDP-N-acetylglucosamine--N-acetylmuramyl-(pentapeptide) pyrophosphoryl-undecaprenol N-acetylglucosamine transferase